MKCFIPTTGKVRDVDTLQFFPKAIPFPAISTDDNLCQAATDIIHLLKHTPTTLPYLQYGDKTKNALTLLATLLGQASPLETQ